MELLSSHRHLGPILMFEVRIGVSESKVQVDESGLTRFRQSNMRSVLRYLDLRSG